MSHEKFEASASYGGSSQGEAPRTRDCGCGFYPGLFVDRLRQVEERAQRELRFRWYRRPRAVDRALRELDEVGRAAGAVLGGEPGAREVFRRIIGGVAGAGAGGAAGGGGAANPLLEGGLELLSDLPCAGRLAGALEVMQAGFAIDLAERSAEPRWTARGRAYVDARTSVVDRYGEAMRADLNQPRGSGMADPRGQQRGEGLGIPVDPDIPGGPGGPLPPEVPGGGGPGLPPPDGGGVPPLDPCAGLADLCLGLYQEMVAEGLNDHLIGLIQTVRPNCLCHDFDPATVFTAEPGPGSAFPNPLPAEVMLIYRGEEITARIVHADAQRIEFRLPPGVRTGYVYLRALSQGLRGRRQDLSRICGDLFPPIPDGALLENSPNALVSIVYPPVIESVQVRGIAAREQVLKKGEMTVHVEACRAIEICWRARLSDQATGLPLPPCASILVAVQDEAKQKVATGGPSGCFFDQDAEDRVFEFEATSLAGNVLCGRSEVVLLRVRREARLRLRLEPSGTQRVTEGGSGQLVVSCSCPAPEGGRRVGLAVSRAGVLDIPGEVVIRAGRTQETVAFSVLPSVGRTVDITATAARHRSATLTLEIFRPRAIVLSGGGAKGSFQVGAIAYFSRERWDEVEPDIIVGTSVGAINALGIAEGGLDGIQRMERIWLGLRKNADMYEDSVWVTKLKELLADIKDPSEYIKAEAIIPGALFGGLFGGIVGLLAGAGASVADKIQELVDLIPQVKFLYTLRPTSVLVLTNVLFDRIAASGKTLRLATVCLEDGLVYYVTEDGQLVSDVGRDPPFVGELTGTLAQKLTNGAMASAGIPVIFPFRSEEVIANGTSQFMTLVDGGVREVVPHRTASELGARFLIAVSAGPNRVLPFQSVTSDETITQFRNANILNIGVRATELATSEVKYNEISPDHGFCDQVERVFVVPSFEVHGTQDIDPGLILINMAYGSMRAFEMYARFREAVNSFHLFLLIDVSNQISTLRKQIWALEETVLKLTAENTGPLSVPEIPPEALPSYPAAARFFEGPTLREIRRLKQEVFNLVVARVTSYGAESVPKRFDDPTAGYLNPITDWWDTWERHKEPLESLLRGFSLWSALPIAVRVVTRNEVGVPEQVFETTVPPRPVLPPDLALVLA